MTTLEPTAEGSPPKRRCHHEWLATATGCPPGVTSSSAFKVRPRNGFTPSVWKYVPETNSAAIFSMPAPPPTRPWVVKRMLSMAATSENTWVFCWNSRKQGYEKSCQLRFGRLSTLPTHSPLPNNTSWSGRSTGRLRSRTAFNRLKIAVLAPIPSARARTARADEPGFRASIRSPKRRFCQKASAQDQRPAS